MWPMCRRPVTFGGGSSKVKTGCVSPGAGVRAEKSFSFTQYSAHRASMAAGSYDLESSFLGGPSGMKILRPSRQQSATGILVVDLRSTGQPGAGCLMRNPMDDCRY